MSENDEDRLRQIPSDTALRSSSPRSTSPTWRRLKIVAGVIAGVVLLFTGIVWLGTYSSRPAVLVAKLRRAEANEREALIMRLNLARGDVVTPLIEAFGEPGAPPEFRKVCLELLFKRNARAAEERIERALRRALTDSVPAIRSSAVYGFAVYMGRNEQLAVVDLVTDPDPEVRRQVYMLLSAERRGRRRRRRRGRGRTLWGALSGKERKETKEKLIADALRQVERETDRELKELARSIIGRRIEELCDEAIQAAQRSDPVEAERLLESALELDAGNLQARIRLVRFHLRAGDLEKALALADEYGAVLRVPLLSEAPVIDGDPADRVWGEAFASDRFYHSTSRWIARRAEGRTELRAGHRDGKVYIAILAYEEDLDELVVKHKARDSDVWRDDCVELFFDPGNTERDAYQFVINAGGAYFDSYRKRTHENIESEHATGIFRDRGYWACEFAVAASAMGDHRITSESVWGVNIMRTRIGPASEQQAWWPSFGSSHRYHLHPIAVFEGLAP